VLIVQGYIHRDIKLENILMQDLMDPKTLKIADFGLAAKVGKIGLFK